MNNDLKFYLSKYINETITNVSSVSGGDISQAYRIDTQNNSYFLKLNNSKGINMFQTEAYGLELIAKTSTIKTPKVLTFDRFENSAFLLIEYIESKTPASEDFKTLGDQLATLHKCSSEHFGLDQNNFIGSLNQSNTYYSNWTNFYIDERLLPQLQLAKENGLLKSNEIPSIQQMETLLNLLFKNIKPSLLHGDLWSGNYLISKDGEPYLIDPAVYYGHHEVDIAMSKLFGGFDNAFYEAYYSHFSEDEQTKSRIEIYQLYYLLVHLNLFGRSYYGSVVSNLKNFFV